MGGVLGASRETPAAPGCDRIFPAAARALAQASAFQVNVMYDAGIEYRSPRRPDATAASVGIALAVADDVLPKYFAALESAPAPTTPRTPPRLASL